MEALILPNLQQMTDTPLDTDSQLTEVEADWQVPAAIPLPLPLHTKDLHIIDPEFEVTLQTQDDPMQFNPLRKWVILLTICSAALCVASASSAVCIFTMPLMKPCTDSGLPGCLHGRRHRERLACEP